MTAKILLILSLFFSINTLATTVASDADDPYSKIEYFKLDNGLQVFLAPSDSATTANVKIAVATGTESENPSNWGVSHLLEHVLFRDKGLKDEMTYLQLIKEAGGFANGGTGARETTYFGSIPGQKSAWLFNVISKMILETSIIDTYVEREKGTVELERGRPGPITLALGFNPMDYIYPKYLHQPDFWEKEFDYKSPDRFTLSEEQLSNRRLRTEQVQTQYNDFYYPANMKIFISGKFNRNEVMNIIHEKWATLPARSGKKLKPQPSPVPRQSPYIATHISDETPYVYLGTKAWDVSISDQEVMSSYMEYLAHRLMKEIRNIKGQTYTANAQTAIFRGFGYSYIYFETPKEYLGQNSKIAKSYIESQAERGNLSPTEIKDAIDLYLAQYKLRGRESQQMMNYAQIYSEIVEEFGQFSSPYLALKNISPENYTASLKKTFRPERHYEVTYRPSLLFQYDYIVMYALTAIGFFMLLRRWLTGSFANDRVHWIRNVKYPPLRMLEMTFLLVGAYAFIHIQYLITMLFESTNFLQSSVFLSKYVYSMVWTLSLIACAQGLLCLLPRKLMVVDQELLIKSVSYHSRRIPLASIASVEPVRPLKVLFSRRILQVRHRFYYFHQLILKKGLLINMKDGRSYFFGVSSGDKSCTELQGKLKSSPPAETTIPNAA